MSVKGKVKRANEKIKELEKKIKELEMFEASRFFANPEDEELKVVKDNFIKLMLNYRKPLEHSCCSMTISERQLNTMKKARLEVNRNYIEYDSFDFILKV